nr:MAG TPA: hypothetical protein [Caudoviricetes sp.]
MISKSICIICKISKYLLFIRDIYIFLNFWIMRLILKSVYLVYIFKYM